MQTLIDRARQLFQRNPLIAGIGALVLLMLAGTLLIRLVLLLALLAIPVVAGVVIGWHLRSDPKQLAPFFRWRDRFLDGLFRTIEAALRWIQAQLSVLRGAQAAKQPLEPYQDGPQSHH